MPARRSTSSIFFSKIILNGEKTLNLYLKNVRIFTTISNGIIINLEFKNPNKKAVKTTDVQKALEVSRQQAHALLSSLVRKEILQKFGKTKTSYYKLSATTQ